MALYNLADPAIPMPQQLVVDSSLLLALRPGDDNPYTTIAQAFVRRLRPCIAALEMVAWVPLPVLQECYHIILTRHLRRVWESQDTAARLPNWLAMYKRQPDLLHLYSALCRMGYPLIQANALSWALLADERRMKIRL